MSPRAPKDWMPRIWWWRSADGGQFDHSFLKRNVNGAPRRWLHAGRFSRWRRGVAVGRRWSVSAGPPGGRGGAGSGRAARGVRRRGRGGRGSDAGAAARRGAAGIAAISRAGSLGSGFGRPARARRAAIRRGNFALGDAGGEAGQRLLERRDQVQDHRDQRRGEAPVEVARIHVHAEPQQHVGKTLGRGGGCVGHGALLV